MTVAGILAFLAPLIATALYRLTTTPQVKQLIAVGVAVVLAAIALLITGGFTPPDPSQPPVVYWMLVLFQIIAVAQIAYALVWKNSTINDKVALATSTEAEREKFVAQNTIQGEVIPEGKEAVPDLIAEATPAPPANGSNPFPGNAQ